MAQYIPGSSVTLSASLRALEKASANDDTEINTRLPSVCVDYLSHDWEEEDVWASWRNMTRHKNEIANGTRLENASWRTWWKQRNKLKTVSPETLNWLKDSDVTWLYGPLHTAADPIPPPKKSTLEERYNLEPESLKGTKQHPVPSKSILKHRTLSELLTSKTGSSLHLADFVGSMDNGETYSLHAGDDQSDPGTSSLSTSLQLQKTISNSSNSSKSLDTTTTGTVGAPADSKQGRHIQFNTWVEQCVAYPPVSSSPSPRGGLNSTFAESMGMAGVDIDMIDEEEYDDLWAEWATGGAQQRGSKLNGYPRVLLEEEEEEEESGDDVLEIKTRRMRDAAASPAVAAVPRPPTPPASASRPQPHRSDSIASTTTAIAIAVAGSNGVTTIKKIAPTILKPSGIYPAPSPQVVFAPPPGADAAIMGLPVEFAASGPLSPGYVSEGYDLLPIQMKDSLLPAVQVAGAKAWTGKASWQRRSTPSGPQTAAFYDEDDSSSSDSAAYDSAYGPVGRLATPIIGELEEEDEDAGVGIDYFSARTPTPSAVAHHPYVAQYEAEPTSAVSVQRQALPRTPSGGSNSAPSSPSASRRHHHYVGQVPAAGASVMNGRGRAPGANGVLPAPSAPSPSPSASYSQQPATPSSPRAARAPNGGILKNNRRSSTSPHQHHARRASSPDVEPARGRSSTRSPPGGSGGEERERSAGGPVSVVASPGVATPQPAVSSPRTRRTSAAKRASGVVPTIDTSPANVPRPPTSATASANASATASADGTTPRHVWPPSTPDGLGSGSGSNGFPSPTEPSFPPSAGVSLQRSTSSTNVRAAVGMGGGGGMGQGQDGDGLMGKAVGMVRALWGSAEGGR